MIWYIQCRWSLSPPRHPRHPQAASSRESYAPGQQTWMLFRTRDILVGVEGYGRKNGCAYNRGDVGKLHVASDRDSLDQELVLTLGILGRLILHGLEKHCFSQPLLLDRQALQADRSLTLDVHMLSGFYAP